MQARIDSNRSYTSRFLFSKRKKGSRDGFTETNIFRQCSNRPVVVVVLQWDNQNCDQWCYYDHGVDICASEYTAADHAEKQNLYKLNQLINEIRQGKRKPGQSLTVLNIPNYVTKSAVQRQEVKAERVGVT